VSATFTGAKRKVIYKSGLNNTWIQIPKFWAGYVGALHDAFPTRVNIDMDESGVLTITPDEFEKVRHPKYSIDIEDDGTLEVASSLGSPKYDKEDKDNASQ
jgi:hypothetical protein